MAINVAKIPYPARPKRPKGKLTLAKAEGYQTRLKDWAAKCKEIDRQNAKGKTVGKAIEGLLKK